jgi:hypothetical protein
METKLIRLSDLSPSAQEAVLVSVDRFAIWLEYKRESIVKKAKKGKGGRRKKKQQPIQ